MTDGNQPQRNIENQFNQRARLGMMQSSQGGDLSLEPWLGNSKKIGPRMQENALGFS